MRRKFLNLFSVYLIFAGLFLLCVTCQAADPNIIADPNAPGDALQWLTVHWADILQIIAGIIAVASIVVKLTPTQKDDTILARIIAFLKVLSLNKGNK